VCLDAEVEDLTEELLASGSREEHRAVLDVLCDDLRPAPLVRLRLHRDDGQHRALHLLDRGLLIATSSKAVLRSYATITVGRLAV